MKNQTDCTNVSVNPNNGHGNTVEEYQIYQRLEIKCTKSSMLKPEFMKHSYKSKNIYIHTSNNCLALNITCNELLTQKAKQK